MTSRLERERRWQQRQKERLMAESRQGYENRVRQREEANASAQRSLAAIAAMDEGEYSSFLQRLTAAGYTMADLLAFRIEAHIAADHKTPYVPEVRDEDITEDSNNE